MVEQGSKNGNSGIASEGGIGGHVEAGGSRGVCGRGRSWRALYYL